jgi:ATP-binding cassette subfamily B protein
VLSAAECGAVSFAMEDTEKQRFLRDVAAANRVGSRGVGVDTGFGAEANLVVTAARLTAVAAGGYFVLRGQTTVGTLVAFRGHARDLFGPVQGLSGILPG